MSTKGIPIPSPTPRPTLRGSVFELALSGVVTEVCELLWEGAIEVGLAVVRLVKDVDDGKAVEELIVDELWASFVMLK